MLNRFFGKLSTSPATPAEIFQGHWEDRQGCFVLLHGYLADRDNLSARLGRTAADPADDAELIALAYRRWGERLQAEVLGEYAVLVYDRQAQSALLTHDALGLSPLFYADTSDGLRFATHLIDLLDADNTATLDGEFLADFLALGYFATAHTPYPGIRRLLPGMSLTWRGGRLRVLQTWQLAKVEPLQCRSDGDYQERFRALLAAGVNSALAGPGKAWVSLSGGLDSSTIACTAAQLGKDGLAAYSLINPDCPEADEQAWMKAVVEHCNIPWHPLDVAEVLPFSRLPDAFFAEPTGAYYHAARRLATDALFSAHQVSALLSGDGGDSILGVWAGPIPSHLADPLFAGHPLDTLKAVRAWTAACEETRPWSYWLLRAVLSPAYHHLRGLQIRSNRPLPFPPWLEAGYAAQHRLPQRALRRLSPRCPCPGLQQMSDTLWVGALSLSALPATHLRYAMRHPLLYRPLVEFMYAIPWDVKLRPRCDRYLQRRALKGILPDKVRKRAYKAIGTWPFVEGMRRSKDWADYLCDSPQLAEHGIADAQRWRMAVRQASLGQTHGDRHFLTGVMVEAFFKELQRWRASQPMPNLPPPNADFERCSP